MAGWSFLLRRSRLFENRLARPLFVFIAQSNTQRVVFCLTEIHSLSILVYMKPNELKKLRKEMGARQKDLATVLGIATRTYQNWEQEEGKREHRKIPDDIAERVQILAELKGVQEGTSYPSDLVWLQIPLRETELAALKRAANFEDKSVTTLVRECVSGVMVWNS